MTGPEERCNSRSPISEPLKASPLCQLKTLPSLPPFLQPFLQPPANTWNSSKWFQSNRSYLEGMVAEPHEGRLIGCKMHQIPMFHNSWVGSATAFAPPPAIQGGVSYRAASSFRNRARASTLYPSQLSSSQDTGGSYSTSAKVPWSKTLSRSKSMQSEHQKWLTSNARMPRKELNPPSPLPPTQPQSADPPGREAPRALLEAAPSLFLSLRGSVKAKVEWLDGDFPVQLGEIQGISGALS